MILSFLEQTALYNALQLRPSPPCDAVNSGINKTLVGARTRRWPTRRSPARWSPATCASSDITPTAYRGPPPPIRPRARFGPATCLAASQYYETYNARFWAGGRPVDEGVFSGTDSSTTIAAIKDGTSNTVFVGESRLEKTDNNYGGWWGQGLWTSTHAMVYTPANATPDIYLSTLPNAPALKRQVANNPRKTRLRLDLQQQPLGWVEHGASPTAASATSRTRSIPTPGSRSTPCEPVKSSAPIASITPFRNVRRLRNRGRAKASGPLGRRPP